MRELWVEGWREGGRDKDSGEASVRVYWTHHGSAKRRGGVVSITGHGAVPLVL